MATSTPGFKLSQISTSSVEERAAAISNLISSAFSPDKEYVRQKSNEIGSRIKKFERRYEMSSKAMKQQLSTGSIKETAEICSWLLLLKVEASLESYPATAQAE